MNNQIEIQILTGAISGGMVVIFGAAYALFFALSNLFREKYFMKLSYISYIFLFISVILLIESLNLQSGWLILTLIMLIGYWFAQRIIWHLCAETH